MILYIPKYESGFNPPYQQSPLIGSQNLSLNLAPINQSIQTVLVVMDRFVLGIFISTKNPALPYLQTIWGK